MTAATAVSVALPGQREAELRALVERAARHEEAALGELYDRTSGLIHSLAMRMLGRREDAEEVTLDTYTKAWRYAGSYEPGRGSVTSWLVVMARSTAIDRIRARGGGGQASPAVADLSEEPAPEPGPEASAWSSQQRARVQRALASLPAEQRRAVELAFFSGMTHAELAAAIGAPLGTVKTRVRLGLRKLRELLEDLA